MCSVIGFAGGRVASARQVSAAAALAVRVVRAGGSVSVGCASGLDWAVVRAVCAVCPRGVMVFCAWPQGSGAAGARRARWAASRGSSVIWSAGGTGGSVGFRLSRRSVFLARSGLSCLVAVPSHSSRGTWVTVRAARLRGVPVSGAFRQRWQGPTP